VEDISTAVAPVESAPTVSEPAASPARWGVDSGGNVSERPTTTEQPASRWGVGPDGNVTEAASSGSAALTTDKLGSTLDSPALDESGNISGSLVERIAANMREERTGEVETAALKEFGTAKEIRETLSIVDGLYNKPDGVMNALKAVEERSPETAGKIFATVVAANPMLAISQLSSLGYLPQAFAEPPSVRQLSPELKAVIPLSLQPTAMRVPEEALQEMVAANDYETLVEALTEEKENIEQWTAQQEIANSQWARSVAAAEAEGLAELEKWDTYYKQKHFEQLSKWKPTPNEQTNNILRNMVFAAAIDNLLLQRTGGNETWLGIQKAMVVMFQHAPVWRLCGDHFKADDYSRQAFKLAERFNVRLGQIMKDMIANPNFGLNTILKGGVKEKKEQKEESPGPEPQKFDSSYNITPEWDAWFMKKLAKGA
jgi:hypothetical protein